MDNFVHLQLQIMKVSYVNSLKIVVNQIFNENYRDNSLKIKATIFHRFVT